MIIRAASIEDLDAIVRINHASFSSPWSEETFTEELTEPERKQYFVVEEEGQVVGYAGIWLVTVEAQLISIAVDPAYRRHRIGAMLVKKVLKESFEHPKIDEVFLEVRLSNIGAQTLYRRAGFTVVAVRKDYYSNPVEDAYIMHYVREGTNES